MPSITQNDSPQLLPLQHLFSINIWRHISPSHRNHQVITCSYWHSWQARSSMMIHTQTSHGRLLCRGWSSWGKSTRSRRERCASIWRGRSSNIEGVWRDGMQGFREPRPLIQLIPFHQWRSRLHCPPLYHLPPLVASPCHCQTSNISIPPHLLCHHSVHPENTLPSVVYIVTHLLCVTRLCPSPTGWHCGSFSQGRVSFVIAGVLNHYLMDKNWYVYLLSTSCLLLGLVTGVESLGSIRSHHLAATSVLDMLYHILLLSRLGSWTVWSCSLCTSWTRYVLFLQCCKFIEVIMLLRYTMLHWWTPSGLRCITRSRVLISVSPMFYEYLFTVNADTIAEVYSLNHLILCESCLIDSGWHWVCCSILHGKRCFGALRLCMPTVKSRSSPGQVRTNSGSRGQGQKGRGWPRPGITPGAWETDWVQWQRSSIDPLCRFWSD